MCEASSMYPHRDARVGDIAKVGTVPGTAMRGLFEHTKPIGGPAGGKLVCVKNGAQVFIERINFMLKSRMHNSEWTGRENFECTFLTLGREWGEGDGFTMPNGDVIPLTEIEEGTLVRAYRPFVVA